MTPFDRLENSSVEWASRKIGHIHQRGETTNVPEHRLSELCQIFREHGFEARLEGQDHAVSTVNTLEDAQSGEITFLSNPRYTASVANPYHHQPWPAPTSAGQPPEKGGDSDGKAEDHVPPCADW